MARKMCDVCRLYFTHKNFREDYTGRNYCWEKCYNERNGGGPQKMPRARKRCIQRG
jgi:hypothetical protein